MDDGSHEPTPGCDCHGCSFFASLMDAELEAARVWDRALKLISRANEAKRDREAN